MYAYKNSKGATIKAACKITGGGWEPVKAAEADLDTRAGEAEEPKPKTKRKKS